MEGYIIGMIYKLYSYDDFKWKGHISFINNMKYTEIKHICDDIYNEVEAHIWSDAPKLNTDEVFRNAIIFHGLSSMSVRVNMGITKETQPQEQICIYKLDGITYPEFAQIYYKISTGIQDKGNINFDATLSEVCPQYFYWRGL